MASVLDRWQEHPDVEIIWNKITESHPGPPPQAFIGWVLDTRTWRRAIASPSKAAAMLSTTTKRGRCWYLRLLARDEERGAAFDRQAAENLPPRALSLRPLRICRPSSPCSRLRGPWRQPLATSSPLPGRARRWLRKIARRHDVAILLLDLDSVRSSPRCLQMRSGLVRQIGQDSVQSIIAAPFAKLRK